MRCPRDNNVLVSETYEGDVVADRCPACYGRWLDKGELEKVQQALDHDYSRDLSEVNVVAAAYEMARQKMAPPSTCPKCSESLHAEEYAYCSQIIIDRCGGCGGVWLDQGETQALERFFERESGLRRGFLGSLSEKK